MKLGPVVDFDPFAAEAPAAPAPQGGAAMRLGAPVDFDPFTDNAPPAQNAPLPPERPADIPRYPAADLGPNGEVPNAPVMEDQTFRTNGGILDAIVGATAGQNTGSEMYADKQKREAAKAEGYQGALEEQGNEKTRRFMLEAAAARGNTYAQDQLAIIKGQEAVKQGPLTLADRDVSKSLDEMVGSRRDRGATQGLAADSAERVMGGIAGVGNDTITAVQRAVLSPVRLAEIAAGDKNSRILKAIDENADARRQVTEKWTSPDFVQAQDMGDKFLQGGASTLAFALGGGGLARMGVKGGIAIAGALPEAESMWKEAEKQGGTELQKWLSFALGGAIGATEALPIEAALESGKYFLRLDKLTSGGLTRAIGHMALSGGEEAVQEFGQQVLENTAVKRAVLGDDTPATEGAAENALVGLVSGMAMSGGSHAIHGAANAAGRMAERNIPTPETSTPEQIDEFIRKSMAGQPAQEAPQPPPREPTTREEIDAFLKERKESEDKEKADKDAAAAAATGQTGQTGQTADVSGASERQNPAAPSGPAEASATVGAPRQPTPQEHDENRLLLGAGLDPQEIADMNRAERKSALQEAQESGAQPVEQIAPDVAATLYPPVEQPAPTVSETTPEPASDIAAQVAAMGDPKNPKTAVFVATGNESAIPGELPDGAMIVRKKGVGTLITTDPAKADAFRKATSDSDVGAILGIPDTKENAGASGAPVVIQGKDKDGNVVAEAASSPEKAAETQAAIEAQTPQGGSVEAVSPQDAQKRREELNARLAEQTERDAGWKGALDEKLAQLGSRAAPVRAETPADVDAAAAVANTEPTEGQKDAGNYQMGHVRYGGLDITIETPKGATRTGSDSDGNEWSVEMPGHYGYVKGSKGKDGDHVDVYLGDRPNNGRAYIIDQMDAKTGRFDEHKIVLGVDSVPDAEDLYAAGFSDGRGMDRIGGVKEVSLEELKDWLAQGRRMSAVTEAAKKLDKAARAAKRPKTRDREGNPLSLVQFLRLSGGLKDDGGELSARGFQRRHPGLVNNKAGMGLDRAREMAVEAGYLRDGDQEEGTNLRAGSAVTTSSVNDLLTALDNHPTYSIHDEERLAAKREDADRKAARDRDLNDIEADILREVEADGLTREMISPDTLSLAASYIHDGQETDLLTALERATIALVADEPATRAEGETLDWIQAEPPKGWDDETDTSAPAATGRNDAAGRGEDAGRPGEGEGDSERPNAASAGEDSQAAGGQSDGGAAAGEAEGRPAAEEEGPLTGRAFRELIKSSAWKKARAAYKEETGREPLANAHPESSGAMEILKGYTDATSGKEPDESQFKPFTPVHATAFNPANGYATGYLFGKTGVYDEPRDGDNVATLARLKGEAAKPTEETGADGKPQTVLPGAEQISSSDLAKKKAEEGLKPKADQKDVDGFDLFGGKRDQTDMFDAEPKTKPEQDQSESPFDPSRSLSDAFADAFARGRHFPGILQARKFAKETHGEENAKRVEEELELGVVKLARHIAARTDIDEGAKFNALVDLYGRMPNLGTRTSTSIEQQAYSTPIPLAYVASRLAEIGAGTTVYEPSAGNGALLMEANPANATANELNPDRFEALKGQGFKTTQNDASTPTQARVLMNEGGVDAVIANPPFGVVKNDKGQSISFDLSDFQPGYRSNEIDHAISLRALDAMKPDGKAVLIIGSVNKLASEREAAYNGKAKRQFFLTLYNRYNVVDIFTVDGDLYSKQGAGWPVDVIVIHGRGKSSLKVPAVSAPEVLSSWDAVKERLSDEYRATLAARAAHAPDVPADDAGGAADGSGAGSALAPFERPDDAGLTGRPTRGGVRAGDGAGQSGAAATAAPRDGQRDDRGQPDADDRVDSPGRDDVDEPSFLKTFSPARRALFDAWEPANRDVAMMLGRALDKMRAEGTADAERISRLQGKLNDILSIIPEPPIGQAAPKPKKRRPGEPSPFDAQSTRDWYDDFMRKAAQAEKAAADAANEATGARYEKGPRPQAEKPQPKKPEKTEQETETQVAYKPASVHTQGLGTLAPVNMRDAISAALARVNTMRNGLDQYVATRLGYPVDKLKDYFSAEQVDALALAFDNFDKGAGFIIGDQTGIGKGRVVAGVIRYALIQGKTPIFVTEKPKLYGDMYRDLTDIGIQEMLGREPRILITDTAKNVPLREGLSVKTGADHEDKLRSMDGLGGHDMLFTTYAQMQTVRGKETGRRDLLKRLAPNAILLLDESHNAGGQKASGWKAEKDEEGGGKPTGRAGFVRELVEESSAVFYSSATYAKRPDVMDLYSKTDMRLAVGDISELGEAIAKGGVPMQQAVASMLARSGQYIRRERSFAGVTYDTVPVDVDREQYDGFSRSLMTINELSNYVKNAMTDIKKRLAETGHTIGHDNATGDAGATSTNFTSVMHNVIGQMLLALKAGPAADLAIEALRNGEKPVIALASTMESFLSDYAEAADLKPGDTVSITFKDVLLRYLDRSRTISIKDPFTKESKKHYLTDGELGPQGVLAYKRAKGFINDLTLDTLPVSPVDFIRQRIEKAGYSVSEITGRDLRVDYSNPRAPVLARRAGGERTVRGITKTVDGFNDGTIDAVILNQSGATGLSLHANKPFKNRNRRRMIIAQPEANIDTFMQMLGRVHRTGQVIEPAYSQMLANIPAEKRPASVLAKKMASLNANTTGSRGGAMTSDTAVDFMNEYGDKTAARYLAENVEINLLLDSPLQMDEKGRPKEGEGLMRKLTGRMTMLPLLHQESLYDQLEGEYRATLQRLEAAGINTLEAKTLDLDAKLIEAKVAAASEGDSPFTSEVVYGLYDIKRQGKPFTARDVITALAAGAKIDPATLPENNVAALEALAKKLAPSATAEAAEALEAFKTYRRAALAKIGAEDAEAVDKQAKLAARLDATESHMTPLLRLLVPGDLVRITTEEGGSVSGVVAKRTHKEAVNPIAPSSWEVTIAVPDGVPLITMPLSQLTFGVPEDGRDGVEAVGWSENAQQTLDVFDKIAAGGARIKRVIATGNILRAYNGLGNKGTIINFTDDQGEIHQGIMLPKGIDNLKDAAKATKSKLTAEQVLTQINALPRGVVLRSLDGNVAVGILRRYPHNMVIQAAKAKSKGGKYFLNPQVRSLVQGGDFYGNTSNMQADVPDRNRVAAINALMDAGAVFELTGSDSATEYSAAPSGWDVADTGNENTPPARSAAEKAKLRAEIEDNVGRIIGTFIGSRLDTADRFFAEDTESNRQAARNSGGTGDLAGGEHDYRGSHRIGRMPDGTLGSIIEVAMGAFQSAKDVHETAFHELWHALHNWGFVSKQERKLLEAEAPRLRAMLKRRLPGYNVDAMPHYEVQAYAFGLFGADLQTQAQAGDGMHIGIRRLFVRAMEMLRSIRNYLMGRGFQTAESVFRKAFSGEMGARTFTAADGSSFIGAEEGARYGSNFKEQQEREYSTFSQQAQDEINRENAAAGLNPTPPRQSTASFEEPRLTTVDEVIRQIQDEFRPLEKIQNAIGEQRGAVSEGQDAYLAVSLYPGRSTERLEDFRTDMVQPLAEKMQAAGVTVDDMGQFLLARHAPERNAMMQARDPVRFANGGGSGLADAAADAIMDKFRANGTYGALATLARDVDAMIEKDRQNRLDAGLISDEQAEGWRDQYKHYVPLFGFAESDEDLADERPKTKRKTGRGFDVRGREAKEALGRRSLSDNPLINTILQYEEGVIRAEKNRVGKVLLRLVKANPNPELWQVNRRATKRVLDKRTGMVKTILDGDDQWADNAVVVKIGGVPNVIHIHNPALVAAYARLGTGALHPLAASAARMIRLFSSLQTSRNPDFFIPNFDRDAQDAAFAAFSESPRLAKSFFKHLPKALYDSIRIELLNQRPAGAASFDEWRHAGGKIGYNAFREATEIMRDVQNVFDDLAPADWTNPPKEIKRLLMKLLRKIDTLLRMMGDAIETSNRLAMFRAARENGFTPQRAASLGRESTTNFNRRGALGPAMSTTYAFMNARIQGAAITIRRLIRSKWARGLYLSMIPLGFAMTMLNLAASDDDEEKGKKRYSMIPEYERSRNVIILNTQWKNPLGFVLMAPWGIGEQLAMMAWGQVTPGQAAITSLSRVLDSFSPLPSGEHIIQKIMPTLLGPLTDLTLNRNFADRPIVPDANQRNDGVPRSSQYFRSTSPMAIAAAQKLNSLTGGDRFKSGMLDMYPGHLEYMLGWATGGVGRFVGNSLDAGLNKLAGVETPPEKIPVLRRFVVSDQGIEQSAYFKAKEETTEVANQLRSAVAALRKNPQDAEAKAAVERTAKELGVGQGKRPGTIGWAQSVVGVYEQADKQLKGLRAQQDAVRSDPELSRGDRMARSRKLDEQIEAVMRKARGTVKNFGAAAR